MISTMNYLDVSVLTTNLSAGFNNEEIVVDERAAYTPSDLVQQKLQGLMPASSIPVSCLHSGRQVRRYNT
jgi:hypothetical protein